MKQIDDKGRVICSICNKPDGLVEWSLDKDGKVCVVCIKCRDLHGQEKWKSR